MYNPHPIHLGMPVLISLLFLWKFYFFNFISFFFLYFYLWCLWNWKKLAEDLSITRIAGLTWSEWNARLAMPLVTSLREGKHPLLFPTDLTIEKQSNCSSNKSTLHEQSTSSSPDRKSPGFYSPNNTANCISSNALTSTPANSGGKLTLSSSSNTNNNSINSKQQLHCSSGSNNSNNNNSKVNNNYSLVKSELKSSLDGTCSDTELDNAGTFVDSKNGLCNISLLSSLSAMSTFMNSAAGGSSAHSLGLGSGSASALGVNSMSNSGHPCPDCGRLYKLKSSLRNHQKWECGKEPQFKCPFCVYRAKQKMHIGRHMERMHKEKFMKFDEKIFAAAAEEAGVHLPPFLN